MSPYEKWTIGLQLLILVAGILTVIVYYRQLGAMKGQLRAFFESTAQTAHMSLLNLAISDKDIIEVWRSEAVTMDMSELKCHMFVNLHLSHMQTLFELGSLSSAQLRTLLTKHFTNKYYRAFWGRARKSRREIIDDSSKKAQEFHQLCEEVYSSANATQQDIYSRRR